MVRVPRKKRSELLSKAHFGSHRRSSQALPRLDGDHEVLPKQWHLEPWTDPHGRSAKRKFPQPAQIPEPDLRNIVVRHPTQPSAKFIAEDRAWADYLVRNNGALPPAPICDNTRTGSCFLVRKILREILSHETLLTFKR
ncbi:hypothetical protein PZA11_006136 [Diplocarpon coronariae]